MVESTFSVFLLIKLFWIRHFVNIAIVLIALDILFLFDYTIKIRWNENTSSMKNANNVNRLSKFKCYNRLMNKCLRGLTGEPFCFNSGNQAAGNIIILFWSVLPHPNYIFSAAVLCTSLTSDTPLVWKSVKPLGTISSVRELNSTEVLLD